MQKLPLFVECQTSEFDALQTGAMYAVEEVGENSFMIAGKWYGMSNFKIKQ